MSSVYGGFSGSTGRSTQSATPTAGSTVIVGDGSADILLWMTPGGVLATLTVQLPTDAGSFIGQEIAIGSSTAVTVLTVNGATSVLNALAALVAGGLFTMKKVAANTWARAA